MLAVICAVWALIVSGLMLAVLAWPHLDDEMEGMEIEFESNWLIAAVAAVGFVAAAGTLLVEWTA